MLLLVGVADSAEALDAAAGGADIVDVRNPAAGALGTPLPQTLRAVRRSIPPGLPLSTALGDRPGPAGSIALAAVGTAAFGVRYVHLGLRDTTSERAINVLRTVKTALEDFNLPTRLVAAGFADALRAGSPPPLVLPDIASQAGIAGCLLTTAIKDGSGLAAWMDMAALHAFVRACRERELSCMLAGSLTLADIPRIAALQPDVIGFRAAACRFDHAGSRISLAKVIALRRALDAQVLPLPSVVPAPKSGSK
jgi:uncharacterized protein (UPF0264 family)